MLITNTGGCHGMGTLQHCTAAALSCIQWKAHHKFHVPHDIEYLQLQQQLQQSTVFSGQKSLLDSSESIKDNAWSKLQTLPFHPRGRTFRTNILLASMSRSCPVCLWAQIQSHSMYKPYRCSVCGRKLSETGHLTTKVCYNFIMWQLMWKAFSWWKILDFQILALPGRFRPP